MHFRDSKLTKVRKAIVDIVIQNRLAFRFAESTSMHRLVEILDPRSVRGLMSANTVKADILRFFQNAKATVIQTLSTAKSNIHYSFDLWTSPNYKAVLAIIEHWTGDDYEVHTALLAIRELHGQHSDRNIALIVFDVAKKFDFINRIGYFVGDNATNNDTAVKWLNAQIIESGGKGFDIEDRRLRCFAHELQIAVKGLLFGPKIAELDEYESMDDLSDDQKADLMRTKWRSFGAIGKLHNIVKYIRHSPQRREAYKVVLEHLISEAQTAKVPSFQV